MAHKKIKTLINESSARDSGKKVVRIDDKLVILVDQDIPDEEDRREFLFKLEMNRKLRDEYKPYRQ